MLGHAENVFQRVQRVGKALESRGGRAVFAEEGEDFAQPVSFVGAGEELRCPKLQEQVIDGFGADGGVLEAFEELLRRSGIGESGLDGGGVSLERGISDGIVEEIHDGRVVGEEFEKRIGLRARAIGREWRKGKCAGAGLVRD